MRDAVTGPTKGSGLRLSVIGFLSSFGHRHHCLEEVFLDYPPYFHCVECPSTCSYHILYFSIVAVYHIWIYLFTV